MAQLTIGTLIKIILGIAVVVIVVGALGFLFGGKIVGFFKSLSVEEELPMIVLGLIK